MCRTDFYTFVKCQNLLKTTPFFGTNAVCEHYGNWNHCKSADAGINAGSACSEKLISLGFFCDCHVMWHAVVWKFRQHTQHNLFFTTYCSPCYKKTERKIKKWMNSYALQYNPFSLRMTGFNKCLHFSFLLLLWYILCRRKTR